MPAWQRVGTFFIEDSMNLKEVRNMIASIVDYDPEVQTYRDEVNRIVNEIYRNWFVSRPYEFSQKTVDVFTMPDADIPSAAIAGSNSEVRNFIQAAALDKTKSSEVGFTYRFLLTHEGSIVIVSGDDESSNNGTYIIDKVDFGTNRVLVSKMSSTPQVDWAGTVATSVTGDVQQRFLTLPQDCAQILALQIRNLNEGDAGSGTNALGKIYSLTRRREEEFNLRYDLTGTPTEYIVYDGYPEHTLDIDQFTPRAGKDFNVVETSNTPGWPQGTYEFKMAYVWRGIEGQLSDPIELKITTSNKIPQFVTQDTTRQGFSGLRKKFYVRVKSITGIAGEHEEAFFRDLSTVYSKTSPNTGAAQFNFFIIDDDETTVSWPQTQLTIQNNEDLWAYARQEVNLTNRKRVRLYPRPASITPVEFRYIFMPVDLEDDFDVPKCPDDTHRYLVYQACSDLFIKHNNPDMADYYQKKADKELLKIDNKYLTQRSAMYIKDNYISGPLRVKPFQTLTKLPDA